MEEYNNEKYNNLENVENLFKRINRFGNEYNYCFGCFVPPSLLPMTLGAIGGIIETSKRKNITGYFVNKNKEGICLIPLIVDDNKIIQIDIDGYIDIKSEKIKSVKIRSEDFIYKRITITLNDETKYIMMSAKKIKGANYHKTNLNSFIQAYS